MRSTTNRFSTDKKFRSTFASVGRVGKSKNFWTPCRGFLGVGWLSTQIQTSARVFDVANSHFID